MGQFSEFLLKILDASDWPPRWVCGKWSEFHGWLYIGSDVVIWLAYFIIPVILLWYIQRRPNIAFLPVFWLFCAFIILCGATHIIDAIIFWWPGYRLSALVKFFTAVVSMVTVFSLVYYLPKFYEANVLYNVSDEEGIELDFQKKREEWGLKLREQQDEIDGLRAEIDQLKDRS